MSSFYTNKIKNFILDILFPKKCLNCNKFNSYLCDACFNRLSISSLKNKKKNTCPICKRPILQGQICKICKFQTNLDGLFWTVPYPNSLVKKLIKNFKYNFIKQLAQPLANLTPPTLCVELSSTPNTVLTPVPLHKKRLKWRGYNQSELLACYISKNLNLPLDKNILARTKNTPPQAKTPNHKERKKALKNAFEISSEFKKNCADKKQNLLKNKTIILVDDVFTSGATMCECSKTLKNAGAKKVFGLVVAKG